MYFHRCLHVSKAKGFRVHRSNNLLLLLLFKKANKRLYFLILLKRANVPACDIVNIYLTVIRPVLEYCAPVFHHALPVYLCM
jgi:hypothetical protein